MRRWHRPILLGLLIAAGPAAAQQVAPEQGLPLPPPADTGKPRLFVPPPSPGCAAGFDCRVRVIGTVQRNGAVELKGTLFKW